MPGCDVLDLPDWSEWRPLAGARQDPAFVGMPGLYRIRRVGRDDLDYVGQSGRSLRGRLAFLGGVFGETAPGRVPHTAAPALWALRQATGCAFEVSVARLDGSHRRRRGMEAVVIAMYRQEHRQSPTVQFGRMPSGFPSMEPDAAPGATPGELLPAGTRIAVVTTLDSSIAPFACLSGDPQGAAWGGHAWSDWSPMCGDGSPKPEPGTGLYRIRGDQPNALVYIGEGHVAARGKAHCAKTGQPGHPQGIMFTGQHRLEWSWVLDGGWDSRQRLELETDLIAAHVLTTGQPPAAQFLGKSGRQNPAPVVVDDAMGNAWPF